MTFSQTITKNPITMRAFNLEEALAGKPVVTRDGREVTDLHFFKGAGKEPFTLYGVINESIYQWTETGDFLYDGSNSNFDLFMQEETKTFYLNIYENGQLCAHSTKALADSGARHSERIFIKLIACKELTYTI